MRRIQVLWKIGRGVLTIHSNLAEPIHWLLDRSLHDSSCKTSIARSLHHSAFEVGGSKIRAVKISIGNKTSGQRSMRANRQ